MTGYDAFGERLGKMVDWIALRQLTEGRRESHGACALPLDGMAARTEPLGNGLTATFRGRLRNRLRIRSTDREQATD